jgi:uncharacterized integral membrane protein
MIYLILYIKIGLILLLLFTIMMGITGQDMTFEDIFVTTFFYPLIIYHFFRSNF